MAKRLEKSLSFALAAVLIVACAVMLLFPLPAVLSSDKERYRCIWADGSVEEFTYAEAYAHLVGISADGEICLKKDGVSGIVATDERLPAVHAALSHGSLLELRTIETNGLSRLAGAALWREYADTVWYADEPFRFDGTSVRPAAARHADRVVFLSGTFPRRYLSETGATRLQITEGAELSASDLIGSALEEVTAVPPYSVHGGGIYRDTAGGRRLVAAIPNLTFFKMEDCDFADAGALMACTGLESLELPFIGSAKSNIGSSYSEMFSHLFRTENEGTMPATLAYIRVYGGSLAAFCFYGCSSVEEIDACGVDSAQISVQAFFGLSALRKLHSPRADVLLSGQFTSEPASCGCTVFERILT